MTVAHRLRRFGQTIFTEMSRRAAANGAVNLGQGFPNFDGPEFVKAAAIAAIEAGHGQYAPSWGVPSLTAAIADRFGSDTGLAIDPEAHVTVTSGCTEALAATFLGLLEPGDEVVLVEPYYDSYPVCASIAGVVPSFVTLRPPGFTLDTGRLQAALTPKTRAIVLNTPHNPTGRVFTADELGAIADMCVANDLVAITDEVYERIVFDEPHQSLATFDGMWERTVTLSSLGKTFSLTGWKVGWAVAPPSLTEGIRAAHQFLTFSTATPLQYGAAAALRCGDEYYEQLAAGYRRRRDLLAEGLDGIGFGVFEPAGTYFLMADHRPFGFHDDRVFADHMVDEVGVAVIPPSVFYHDPADGASLVRFAFCKDEGTLREAVTRMKSLARLRV